MRNHHVLRGVALVTTAVLATTVGGAAAAYNRLQGNVTVADVSALVGEAPEQPAPDPDDPLAGQEVNILLLGSDERDGENGEIGGDVEGMRSDTTIVVHISADRTRAELVSIPRDSIVDIPSCTMTDGSTSWAQSDAMFNTAFAIGWDQGGDLTSAAACTIKTVQANTGLTIDHFAVVDFVGFISMVDALDGVPICISEPLYSADAGLDLDAGYQTLDGTTALAFARARKGTNLNGSDLQRTGRQQELIAAMVRQIQSQNILTDVPNLMSFLSAATASLTVDPALSSLTDMAGLALSLRSLDRSAITFMTIPVTAWPEDPNRVVWTSEAATVWANMVADQPIVATAEPAADASADPTPSATTSASPSADPSASSSATPSTDPTPSTTTTAEPGVDPFTADDITAVCG
ncbi:LCP family protein [Actinotalea sp.]|uniref:LCP family protein n=1 Tax=Actinotalea sp. TaxID=1872145 RepID=UPI00356429C4